MLGRPAIEGGGLLAIHHVVALGMAGLNQARRDGRQFAGQAGRGAVDDQVHRRVDPVITAGNHRAQIGEFAGQLLGLFHRAVGNHQRRRLLGQQRLQHPAHRTAGAEQENAFALEVYPGIHRQITHQAGAVGVVAKQATVGKLL